MVRADDEKGSAPRFQGRASQFETEIRNLSSEICHFAPSNSLNSNYRWKKRARDTLAGVGISADSVSLSLSAAKVGYGNRPYASIDLLFAGFTGV
jgi:hypothetical protein